MMPKGFFSYAQDDDKHLKGGVFENNDLTGNARGAWDIAKGADVTRADNKE